MILTYKKLAKKFMATVKQKKKEILTYDLERFGVSRDGIAKAFDWCEYRLHAPEFEPYQIKVIITRQQFKMIEKVTVLDKDGFSYRGVHFTVKKAASEPEVQREAEEAA